MNTVLTIGEDSLVNEMFMNKGWLVWDTDFNYPTNLDLICFTGGEDVTPSLYGEVKHPLTYNNPERDKHEVEYFNQFIGIPKVGICRGGQFLNVMSGGKLHQHILGHT